MVEFPLQISVGTSKYKKNYNLQRDQLLIRFNDGVDNEAIQKLLQVNNIKKHENQSVSKLFPTLTNNSFLTYISPGERSLLEYSDHLSYSNKEIESISFLILKNNLRQRYLLTKQTR